jgi:hypothetical protein
MKKYCLITTYYNYEGAKPDLLSVSQKFNWSGKIEDLYINFDNSFDYRYKDHLKVGVSGRKDLIYGKIFLLKDFLEKKILGNYEYVCHVDYSDIKFARNFDDMMVEFIETQQDFIISTEKNCWPYIEHMQNIISKDNLIKQEFEYINSGALISKTEILYKYLKELIDLCLNTSIDFWDDQGVWQYLHLGKSNLNMDTSCKYFFSTALLDNNYYYIKDNKIFTKFNTQPYIIHDNSSFSLNLISKI